MNNKKLLILGIRGVPASHGGFETFAEHFSLYMVAQGWDVTVYCQEDEGDKVYESEWRGVRRIHIPVSRAGAVGTIQFDLKSVRHAVKEPGIVLTLGYNTAVFSIFHRLRGQKNVMNMDGIEWKREKWSAAEKAWLYLNEWSGARLANHLIADHPEIKNHLIRHTAPEKVTVIPYGAELLADTPPDPLADYGLTPRQYSILIARPEPENSILEVVKGYSANGSEMPLVVLGKYDPDNVPYHKQVLEAAGDNVKFVGAIYEHRIVHALRYHARVYIHGHTVGGTNPSLVEAMGAGNAVIAHDNPFNRWVIGEGGMFFKDAASFSTLLKENLTDDEALANSAALIRERFLSEFQPQMIHEAYEKVLLRYV